MQIPARELERRLRRRDVRRRHRPHRRSPRALPPDRERARQGGVAEHVPVHSERLPRVVVSHSLPAEKRVEARSELVRPSADLAVVREPAEREDGEVTRGDDVHVVPRSPHLRERRVVPRVRPAAFHACVDRQDRGARHAVLKTGPCRLPQRSSTRREPPVERPDAPPEREDLISRDSQPRGRHARM